MITAVDKQTSSYFSPPPAPRVSLKNNSDLEPSNSSQKNYLSPFLPQKKTATPKAPSFYIVYKFAPGFHQAASVSFEFNHSVSFLNTYG